MRAIVFYHTFRPQSFRVLLTPLTYIIPVGKQALTNTSPTTLPVFT